MAHEENGHTVLGSPLEEGEPYFIVRGNDMLAQMTVEYWAYKADLMGVSPEVTASARRIAEAMGEWHRTHGTKVPD